MLLRDFNDENQIDKFHYLISSFEREKDIEKHTILVVDDEESNLKLLRRTLRKNYKILTASDGKEALDVIEKEGSNISLIVSDQRMPNMNGTEFLSKVSEKYPYIIKMLLTGYTDIEAMIDGVNKCQLFQYISKPVDPNDLELIVKNGIEAYELTLSKNTLLEDLKELFFTTIKAITSALDAKDAYTHGHSHRVTLYSLILAKELNVEETYIEDIEMAGLLHDIGKIGVPENILCKPGRLTDEEYKEIQNHAPRGKKILNNIPGLNEIGTYISCHHERFDGTGYPCKLKGDEIPLASRILAVADTYDAMTSNRSYRKGLPHEVALEEIKNCGATQFDPKVTEAFVRVEHIFREAAINPVKYYDEYSVLNKTYSERAARAQTEQNQNVDIKIDS